MPGFGHISFWFACRYDVTNPAIYQTLLHPTEAPYLVLPIQCLNIEFKVKIKYNNAFIFALKRLAIMPRVEINYVTETQTAVQTQLDTKIADDGSFTLVGKTEFIRLFNELYPNTSYQTKDLERLWHQIIGNHPRAPESGQNPDVHYLTKDSAELIIKHFALFKSGLDYQNLPKGFFLAKNPNGAGIRDVLHYNEFVAKNQTHISPLAITVGPKDSQEKVKPKSFPEPQADWYAFLLKKSKDQNNEKLCSQKELDDAFIHFSNFIKHKNLEFHKFDFNTIQGDVNPIVLLGRWYAVLNNPNLKREDLEVQWQLLPRLPLATGYEAIRVLTDHRRSKNPCGFLLPEMELTNLTDFTGTFAGAKTVSDYHDIQSVRDFWRYISFQPKRNTLRFYQEALKFIDKMAVDHQRLPIMRMLAGGTTGDNHHPETRTEEDELKIWHNVCQLIDNIENLTIVTKAIARKNPGSLKNNFIHHITRLAEQPNMAFLEAMAQHITNYIQKLGASDIPKILMGFDPLKGLEELSDKLNRVIGRYHTDFYLGSRFYLVNRQWQGDMTIKKYTELQSEIQGNMKWIVPHLSTFTIRSKNDLQEVAEALGDLQETAQLKFVMTVFRDATAPIDKKQLLELIQTLKQTNFTERDLTTDNYIQLLDILSGNFKSSFPENYFEQKKQQVLDAKEGLNTEQAALLDHYEFTETQKKSISQIESAMVRHNHFVSTETLQKLNDKFSLLQELILPDEYTLFLKRLTDIREHHFSSDDLDDLLSTLIQQKSLQSFNTVFLQQVISPCTNGNLFGKIIAHMRSAAHISGKDLNIDPIKLHETMARMFLKLANDELENTGDAEKRIKGFIDTMITLIEEHPHTQNQLLEVLNQVKPHEIKGFLPEAGNALKALETLIKIFPATANSSANKENMLIFYSLVSHNTQTPKRLVEIIDMLKKGEDDCKRFFLTYISRLLDREESLEDISDLIDLCIEDSNHLKTLQEFCFLPPYPSIQSALDWLETDSFKENYETFSIKPYGERVTEYTFNFRHYKNQRLKFKGISEDLFTDQLGQDLNEELKKNRSKSMQNLRNELENYRGKILTSADEKRKALTLCVEFLARTAHQAKPGSREGAISQELNTTQIMTLYAMMMQDNPKVLNQIDTGEGKSRIMMVLSALNALQGKTVDFITSDLQLAERDYFDYKQFFNALGVRTGLITLQTPPALYQKGGVNFSDNAQLLLLRNKSDIDGSPYDYLDENRENRCLLLDEVDHFKHDKNKDAFNYASKSKRLSGYLWVYPLLVGFMKAELENMPKDQSEKPDFKPLIEKFMSYVSIHDNVTTHQASLAYLKKNDPDQLLIWLQAAFTALRMQPQKDYVVTDAEDKKLYAVRDHEGFTRYTRKVLVLDNGRSVEGSTFADGVHQCLCAIENEKAGSEQFIILPENETQRSSYAKTFMGQYDNLFGVSGTTRSDAPLSNESINKDNYHYLITPREKPLIREDLNIWAAKDEAQQISFIKREILKAVKENKSVLLACRDDKQSERIYKALSSDESLKKAVKQWQYLHSLTAPADEKAIIRQAGTPGFLTVTSIGLSGRGVHINTKNMETIAAFTPPLPDEIQLKGRSGRFGQAGSYRMIVNLSDPEQPLNGKTYNIANEVDKAQKTMAISAALEEEVSTVYAEFLEKIHQAFLSEYAKTEKVDQLPLLNQWQTYLGKLQKDWEINRINLLTLMKEEKKDEFISEFKKFATKWKKEIPVKKKGLIQVEKSAEKAYQSYLAQKGFFKHERLPIKVQRDYDPADDGQARIYSSLFAQTRAVLRGERSIFADFYAWRDGRGELFPDFMATLRGERPIFANLRATIARLVEELITWYQNTFRSDENNEVEPILAEQPLF
ncbi:hypothetical protein [Legionella londiniensis]|uniref:Coiled-coil protein n=1 Tax=Legionella londiniensis TaxID=45068 RepID=A0A0W0VNY3_9GAMM|nr:hypothetical protein [Legionella londiniensis]KTD21844.1 coiled-coil protein [Legionella londiniensis]STX92673.1 coiled-coil protein [Legionella londiniensis]